MSPVRVIVVGAGGFGRMHARTLAGIAEADLIGVVDSKPEAIDILRSSVPSVRAWPTVDDAIRESDAEAYVIATRTDSHVSLAQQVLDAGRVALVEKPLGETGADVERLASLVRQDSSNLMVGHILLFSTQVQQVLREARCAEPDPILWGGSPSAGDDGGLLP